MPAELLSHPRLHSPQALSPNFHYFPQLELAALGLLACCVKQPLCSCISCVSHASVTHDSISNMLYSEISTRFIKDLPVTHVP